MKRLLVLGFLAAVAAAPVRAESPRLGTFEFGAAWYRPNIDSESGLTGTPLEDTLGSHRGYLFSIAGSYTLFSGYGSLDAGFRLGYFQKKGKGLREDTLQPSGDTTSLRFIETSPFLSYRLDLFADRWKIPLAPYGRVTFERYNWWVTKGTGGTVKTGATNGWSATAGVAFLLDIIDPELSREFDRDWGVNHTYIYVDATKSSVDDFGSSNSWDLSDKKFSYGAGFLFVF